MKQFITGGAGFIGSNYVRYILNNTDDEVTVFDALTYAGNLSTMRDVENNSRYKFVKGNICDAAAVADAMKGHDAVVHFAAESHVDRSIAGSAEFIRTNVMGTHTLLEAARQTNLGRFVHVSTDEVYGTISEGQWDENSKVDTNSPYSSGKASADLIAMSFFRSHGVPVLITRSSNNYGPRQNSEKFVPKVILNILNFLSFFISSLA